MNMHIYIYGPAVKGSKKVDNMSWLELSKLDLFRTWITCRTCMTHTVSPVGHFWWVFQSQVTLVAGEFHHWWIHCSGLWPL